VPNTAVTPQTDVSVTDLFLAHLPRFLARARTSIRSAAACVVPLGPVFASHAAALSRASRASDFSLGSAGTRGPSAR
jgi:hypothetical protein